MPVGLEDKGNQMNTTPAAEVGYLLGYDVRQLKELWLALFYVLRLGAHGTDGHNRLGIIAKAGIDFGFGLDNEAFLTYKGQRVVFDQAEGAKG